jgi:cytochrome c556
MTRTYLLAGAVTLALFGIAPNVSAHESATCIVKEGMDAMKGMAQRVKRMSRHVRAGRDLAEISAHARAIAEVVTKVPPLFPPGSNKHPSEASEKIWRDFADFERRAKTAAEAARQLADADPGDAKLVIVRFRALTKACGTCHETYRVKK